jgi:hypothetical protein
MTESSLILVPWDALCEVASIQTAMTKFVKFLKSLSERCTQIIFPATFARHLSVLGASLG